MSDGLLTVPIGAGELILRRGGVIARPLLGTDKFVKFCKERGLSLNRERLLRLERLNLFRPVFRVQNPDEEASPLSIPVLDENEWFKKRWAWDTTSTAVKYEVPAQKDPDQEAYYSVFQIDHLDKLLSTLTISMQMDSYLSHSPEEHIDWEREGTSWMRLARKDERALRQNEHPSAVALLCQFISDRYFPQTQSNQRTIRVPQGFSFGSDLWTRIYARDWDWYQLVQNWDSGEVKRFFNLTRKKLKHAYIGLAISQSHCDPLQRWYKLVQFVSVHERARLKGDALRAETIRAAAHMIRFLYKDLYKEDLPHPNEVTGTTITHIPELKVRADTRRYLELVVNRYNLNPQPTVSLFVEGPSEETAVRMIFEDYFGAHPGKYGIEMISLGGVDFATGGKEDRYRAILRLIDYLHYHQTFAFLILDNENYVKKLKKAAKKEKSIHHKKRYITRPEYIRIWKNSFELDNFSATEVAMAMSTLCKGRVQFTQNEITFCKNSQYPGAQLTDLYKRKANYSLNKIRLSEILVEQMLSSDSRRKITDRPIIKTLKRVLALAARNPFPTTQATWEKNQASKYFGKKLRK